MSFWQVKSWANWLRDAPVRYDDFLSATPDNAQSAFEPVESVEFPRDVMRLHDQMRRGWNVGGIPEVLILEGLLQLHEKLDRLLPKECGPCPDHPEWAKDGCPWHRAGSEWKTPCQS